MAIYYDDSSYNEEFEKKPQREKKDDCVKINVFCKNKSGWEDAHEGSYQKKALCEEFYVYEKWKPRPKDESCVIINIFCDKCKRYYL